MEIHPDSAPRPKNPQEEFVDNTARNIEVGAMDMVYEEYIHDPKKLQELIDFGWSVKTSRDEKGQLKTIEIRDKDGNIMCFENLEALRQLGPKEN